MAEDTNIQEVVTTQEAEEKKEQKIKCPCCGETTLTKPLDIPSPILDEYLSSILSGVSFSHTYPLYGGKLEVTAVILDKQASRKRISILQMLTDLKRSVGTSDVRKITLIEDLQGVINLYYNIQTINTYVDKKLMSSFEPSAKINSLFDAILDNQQYVYHYVRQDYTGEDKDKIFDILQELYATYCTDTVLSSVPHLMLQAVVTTHSDLYNILLESGFDENFWHGIELA